MKNPKKDPRFLNQVPIETLSPSPRFSLRACLEATLAASLWTYPALWAAIVGSMRRSSLKVWGLGFRSVRFDNFSNFSRIYPKP